MSILNSDKRWFVNMPSDRANIIKKEMLPAFLSDLDSHKVTKEYWDENAP